MIVVVQIKFLNKYSLFTIRWDETCFLWAKEGNFPSLNKQVEMYVQLEGSSLKVPGPISQNGDFYSNDASSSPKKS